MISSTTSDWRWRSPGFGGPLRLEIRLSAKSLFLRKIGRLRTSVDTLPMSGGQGVASSNLASPDQRSEREIGFRPGRHHHRRGSRHPGRCG
jgi:hypothetical protein